MENMDWITLTSLDGITEEWVYSLIYEICQVSSEKRKLLSITSIDIESNLNSGEGALSDICHVSVKAKLSSESGKTIDSFSENEMERCDTEYIKYVISDLDNAADELLKLDESEQQNQEENVNLSENGYSCKNIVYNLFIKLAPDGLKDLIDKHGLFEREITVYR